MPRKCDKDRHFVAFTRASAASARFRADAVRCRKTKHISDFASRNPTSAGSCWHRRTAHLRRVGRHRVCQTMFGAARALCRRAMNSDAHHNRSRSVEVASARLGNASRARHERVHAKGEFETVFPGNPEILTTTSPQHVTESHKNEAKTRTHIAENKRFTYFENNELRMVFGTRRSSANTGS